MNHDSETVRQRARPGWEYRFTCSEPALSEHVAEYEKLGFEVRTEPVQEAGASRAHCKPCVQGSPLFAVYVRRPPDHSP